MIDCYCISINSQVLDMIRDGFFSPESPNDFKDIVDMLLHHDRLAISRLLGETVQRQLLDPLLQCSSFFLFRFLTLADYTAYVTAQDIVNATYTDQASTMKIMTRIKEITHIKNLY